MRELNQLYSNLKEKDKLEFSRLANKLLDVNFLNRISSKDQKDYNLCLEYYSVLKAYFSLIDMELIKDDVNDVIALKTDSGFTRLNLRKNETIVLLILRKLYFDKSKEISFSKERTTTVEEIIRELAALGYEETWINKTEMIRIINLMRKMNCIDTIGQIDQLEITIILLPSILHILSFENLNQIEAHLDKYRVGGPVDESIEEN